MVNMDCTDFVPADELLVSVGRQHIPSHSSLTHQKHQTMTKMTSTLHVQASAPPEARYGSTPESFQNPMGLLHHRTECLSTRHILLAALCGLIDLPSYTTNNEFLRACKDRPMLGGPEKEPHLKNDSKKATFPFTHIACESPDL